MTTTTAATAVPRRRRRARPAGGRGKPLSYLLLAAVLASSVFPLYWTFVVASSDNSAIGEATPPLVPGGNLMENISRVFDSSEFSLALMNSAIVATTVAVGNVFFSALAGFAFARLRFRGRNALLVTVVATMMVPTQLGIIPLYLLTTELGWTGHLQALIVPALVSAFGVFWMRQAVDETVPTELVEAAMMDGCSLVRIFWHVALPAIRPAAAVLGLFTFMGAWNDFFWPLVVLNPENPTVQVALSVLASGYYTDYALMLTGALLGVLPVLAVFLLLARQIVGGIMAGAVKG
ncbi:carbohydrate ABC transporter permease [Catellatospora citrea]|uniref:Sugar ABC transporter permease n=1 Tax=Catellatospora citrea TaxID=53366 RepID=A0A8J3KBX7_9ACTN|nr:carbohydrate ABC transporter permease [Catellatospora citrea]RKE10288.1 cellobiose transport system permease protein [Catellatospora citrea]GIF97799.1 sugar ABC transporter permease [Catellatospora citrea]